MIRLIRRRPGGRRRQLSETSVPAVKTTSGRLRWVAAAAVVWALLVTGWSVHADRADVPAVPFLAGRAEAAVPTVGTPPSATAAPGAGEDRMVAALAAAEGRASDLQREVDRLRSDMIARSGLPMSDLPVVSFVGPGFADAELRGRFDVALVQPIEADASARGAALVGIVVRIPEVEGDPYDYTAIYAAADPLWSTFGLHGSELPGWTPDCPEGC